MSMHQQGGELIEQHRQTNDKSRTGRCGSLNLPESSMRCRAIRIVQGSNTGSLRIRTSACALKWLAWHSKLFAALM